MTYERVRHEDAVGADVHVGGPREDEDEEAGDEERAEDDAEERRHRGRQGSVIRRIRWKGATSPLLPSAT